MNFTLLFMVCCSLWGSDSHPMNVEFQACYTDTIITDTIPGPIYHPKTIDPDNKIFTESTFSKFVKKVKGTPPFIPDVVGPGSKKK